ncbi:IS200/IS605 family transposase [Cognataquiflexum aquatile]|uniref:IS200/IS605 family transposase n=1 Tax=Cognataquiflexum aquatile TaxID=2249427 RepID=UPI000DE87541|nr:IS200/IS605 family transposase [Cognataquiflexum aquatile]
MPFIKIYIHFVWTTKNFSPLLNGKTLREKVKSHILENCINKGIHVDQLAVQKEHCHCLISLGKEQTTSKLMQLIKGESAFWINKENLIPTRFEWQDEYFGVSVSENHILKVRAYIQNQDEHHGKKTFGEEYENFILKCGFSKMK